MGKKEHTEGYVPWPPLLCVGRIASFMFMLRSRQLQLQRCAQWQRPLPTLSAVHTSCLQSVKWAALASGSSIAATRPAGRDGGEVGLISTARARAGLS